MKEETLFAKCRRLIANRLSWYGKTPDELWVSPDGYAELERLAGARIAEREELEIDGVRIRRSAKVTRSTVLVMQDV